MIRGKYVSRLKVINIWTITLLMLGLIFLVLGALATYLGDYFLVSEGNQQETKRNLNYSYETLEENFEQLSSYTSLITAGSQDYKNLKKELANHFGNVQHPNLDMAFLVDKNGYIIWNKNNASEIYVKNYRDLPLVVKCLKGTKVFGYETVPSSIIRAEGLYKRVNVKSNKSEGNYLSNKSLQVGLAQLVGVPIFDSQKRVQGALIVGTLLNGNTELLKAKENNLGIVSIFQDGLRIITNTGDNNSQLAMGTPMEQKVYRSIRKGQTYIGKSETNGSKLVVAFTPLKDHNNNVIGALGVSIDQKPLINERIAYQKKLYFLLIVIFILICILIWWLYKSIIKGLLLIIRSVEEIIQGDLSIRIFTPDLESKWKVRHCFNNSLNGRKPDHQCRLETLSGNFEHIKKECPFLKVENKSYFNQIYYLARMFNNMALSLEERKHNLELRNRQLLEQQEVLQIQQDELEAQRYELILANQQLSATLLDLDREETVIYSLILAIEAKDNYTRGHSERVAAYAEKLARVIGLKECEQEIIKRAGMLHDIGKIGVNDAVLLKPEKLSQDEFLQIKKHPNIGVNICKVLKATQNILPIIKHHHEHYDGSGYPDGLRGKEIPLYARILAIADAYDAMITDRPYRLGMSSIEATTILTNFSGVIWDPDLVPAFVELVHT